MSAFARSGALWAGCQDRWVSFRENSLRPFALQGAVVAAALVATMGGALLLGAVAPQQAVEANDEPLTGFSAPRFLYSAAAEQPVASAGDAPLMVQAMVDTQGRVYDYRVLSGLLGPGVRCGAAAAHADRGVSARAGVWAASAWTRGVDVCGYRGSRDRRLV